MRFLHNVAPPWSQAYLHVEKSRLSVRASDCDKLLPAAMLRASSSPSRVDVDAGFGGRARRSIAAVDTPAKRHSFLFRCTAGVGVATHVSRLSFLGTVFSIFLFHVTEELGNRNGKRTMLPAAFPLLSVTDYGTISISCRVTGPARRLYRKACLFLGAISERGVHL